MTKGERIKYLREKIGLSQVSLADKIDVSKQTLYKYENDIITNIPSDKVEAIAEATGSSPAFIMGWDDLPFYPNVHPVSTRRFPLLGSVACGEPIMMAEEVDVDVDTTEDIKADFCLKCKGDSMINARIYDGDIVFVKKQPTVENGQLAVVAIDDEVTLKRFYKYGELIVLRAENPAYKDMEYRPEDHKRVRVLGRAIRFIGKIR